MINNLYRRPEPSSNYTSFMSMMSILVNPYDTFIDVINSIREADSDLYKINFLGFRIDIPYLVDTSCLWIMDNGFVYFLACSC